MKISINWLRTLIDTELSAEEIAKRLTAAGLEVESMETFESLKGGLKGLVTGQVTHCEKHPDADRLRLTRVDIGADKVLQIVCGAPNVATGQKVIVATVGTTLYPASGESLTIKKSKIRGAESEGMICAEDEIGIGNSHEGIMVLSEDTPVGMPASAYFKVESDTVLEIGLTPNRSDASSHYGVARELAAIINSHSTESYTRVTVPGIFVMPEASGLRQIKVNVMNPEACKRYCGLLISGVKVKESPAWLKTRLSAIGLRPVNNLVDISNFVLHELGQPLHAFDADKIGGEEVVVRLASSGEVLLGLDGVERSLNENDLVICDKDKAMCLAGIFGGLESGVSESTTAVFLESAYFDPAFIRRSAKTHALKTDASFRFERGTDPDMCVLALQRATELILDLCGGNVSMGLVDHYPEKIEAHKVTFAYSNCNELIGKEIDRQRIKTILQNLGMEIHSEGSDGLLLHVPFYKHDVTREADVVEEVMRIYGYDNVEPAREIRYTAGNVSQNLSTELEQRCSDLLSAFGFHEIMGLSLSAEKYYEQKEELVRLINPLSQELEVLRANLLFSGLQSMAYNINRKNKDLKFYEYGKTYHKTPEGYKEEQWLSLWISGDLFRENPYGLKQKSNFAVLKAVVDQLLMRCGINHYTTEELQDGYLAAGLEYRYNNQNLLCFGKVKQSVLKQVDVEQEVYYASIRWSLLKKAYASRQTEFEEMSKYPSVRRDLALLLDRQVSFRQVQDLAYATEKKWLREVNLFDVYEDEKLGAKKSYALSFTLLNKEATLTDQQIEAVMAKLIKAYKEKLGAELRG